MTLEEIKNASINKLEARQKEIRSMNLDEVSNYDELSEEIDAIEERKKELRKIETKKQELRNKIANGEIETRKIEKPVEVEERKMNKDTVLGTPEYRSGYLKQLLGRNLNKEERAAIDMSGVTAAIPEQMQNDVLTKVKEYAPVLNEVTLLHVNGAVKFAVEGTVNAAEIHTENGSITPASDTLVEVTLSTYEIVKLIQISASVKSMSIDAFETWLTNMVAESIAMKLETLIFNGTGSSQPKGVNSISWSNGTNAVEVASSSTPTAKNIFDLVSLFKENEGKFYMNRKTLFGEFLPLQDKSKHDLVTMSNGEYYVLGFKVELTNSIADHEAILGNMKKYVANLSQDMTIKGGEDLKTNSYLFSGCANFDGKPAYDEAFVKLTKGA